MIGLKIGIAVVVLASGAFFVKDYISTKQDNAVLEATLSSTTEALRDYATDVEQEVLAYSKAVEILGERDQEARKTRDKEFSTIEGRDLEKMAERKPAALARILTGRTARLLDALANSGGGAKDTQPPSTGAPGPTESETD